MLNFVVSCDCHLSDPYSLLPLLLRIRWQMKLIMIMVTCLHFLVSPGILVAGVGSVGCHTTLAVIVILFGRQVAAAPRLISTPGSQPGQCCPQWSGSCSGTLTSHKISSYALNGWNITSNKPQISIGSGWARASTLSWLLDSLLSPVKARSVAGCDHDLFHIWSVMDGLCSGSGPRSLVPAQLLMF